VSYKVKDSILILPSGVLYREGTFYSISIEREVLSDFTRGKGLFSSYVIVYSRFVL